MKIWIIAFCPMDDGTRVEICYSPQEADRRIKEYFGSILLGLSEDGNLNEVSHYLHKIYLEKDEDTDYITYAEWGSGDTKEFISVHEEEIETK